MISYLQAVPACPGCKPYLFFKVRRPKGKCIGLYVAGSLFLATLKIVMELSVISMIVAVVALLVALAAMFRNGKKNGELQPVKPAGNFNSVPLQLQAYERLVLLTERISLPNLISRISQPQLSAKEMQLQLLDNIKQEFEYNASQQIYVSPVAWEAVRNLRDQNMLIINQVTNVLPADATGSDLNKQLLEVIMKQEDAALHTIVLNALNFEAKKLMG